MTPEVWSRTVRPLEEWTICMVYHVTQKERKDISKVFLDISKSFEREAYRADGFTPSFLRVEKMEM